MYTPHTVTVYNVVREPDPATLKDVTNLYVTVLDGVFCEAAKGVNVRKSGLEGADAVNLYIPFTVKAVDGFSASIFCLKRQGGPMDAIHHRQWWRYIFCQRRICNGQRGRGIGAR